MLLFQVPQLANAGARSQAQHLRVCTAPHPPQASILTGESYGEDPTRSCITVELEQDLVGWAVHCLLGQAVAEGSELWGCLLRPIPATGKKVLRVTGHHAYLFHLVCQRPSVSKETSLCCLPWNLIQSLPFVLSYCLETKWEINPGQSGDSYPALEILRRNPTIFCQFPEPPNKEIFKLYLCPKIQWFGKKAV